MWFTAVAVAAPDPIGDGLVVGAAGRGVVVGRGAAATAFAVGLHKEYAACCDGHLAAALGARVGVARDGEVWVSGVFHSLLPTDPLDLGVTWRATRGRVELAASAAGRLHARWFDEVEGWATAGPVLRLHPARAWAVEARVTGLVPVRADDDTPGLDAPVDTVLEVARSGFVSLGTGFEAPGRGEGWAVPARGALGWTFSRRDRPFVEVGARASWRRYQPGTACFECGPELDRVWDALLGVRVYTVPAAG